MLKIIGESCIKVVRFNMRRTDTRSYAALAVISTKAFAEIDANCATILHKVELDCYKGLRCNSRRTSYLLGRYAAKLALESLSGDSVSREVAVLPGIFGQPIVRGLTGLSVSIGHTETLACAIAFPEEHLMAIDTENLSANKTSLMAEELTEAERKLGPELIQKVNLHACIWTAKEALSKILRTGMMTPFSLYAVETLDQDTDKNPIVELESCERLKGQYLHFSQYRFQTWIRDDSIITIALPRRTILSC